MTPKRSITNETLDPSTVKLHLSDQSRQAFADLEAAVHFSDHFDNGILATVQDFAKGSDITVREWIYSLPSIAEETFRHIDATGDNRAREAWRSICETLPEEKGFTLTRPRVKTDRSPHHL